MASEKMTQAMLGEMAYSIKERARKLDLSPATDGRVLAWIANRSRTLTQSLKRNDWRAVASILMSVGKVAPTGHSDDLVVMDAYYRRICYDTNAADLLAGWRSTLA